MTKPNDTYSFRLDVIAFMIIAVSFVVRYWFVASGQLNLVQDEAQYWDWIRRPQLSYYSKGPLIAWVISLWCKVFGSTELGVRFGSIIGMTGIQAALYIGISRVWREYRLALYALFVSATMILLNGLGILATTDNPLLLCWTVAFFALSAATRNKPDYTPGNLPFVILGICVAIGILGKYMMLAFVGLGVIYAAILHLRGQLPARFWRRFALASLVGTVVGMLPIILWNMQNDWVGFKHVAGQAAGKPKPFEIRIGPFFEMFGAQIGLMAPWWAVAIAVATWRAIKKGIVGPIGSFDCKYRHTLQALLFFLPLWAIITFWSLKSHTEANWTAAAFMAGAILGGMGLKAWWENPRRKTRGKVLLAGIAAGLTLMIYVTPILPIPAEINMTNRLKGWDSLGQQVADLKQAAFDNPDNVFVVSDKYDITSELAFYTPGQPLTFCAWIGDRRMNQYDIWPGPEVGQDAIFVREHHRTEGISPKITKMFDSVEKEVYIHSMSNGQPMREFTLYVCKGFNGFWPRNNSDRF
ncbi:glycosyltransferase family 39 protein [Pseudodesulfovibrio sp. zrk46]|uniref:ArnT family glycosyltransferase n=1 Tax=Pseudodesulfovibrio sp. zrk46 TaxID=2725288 RepID=UPI001448CD99|nr:glycosyltransferase family 39 protein [Pseudodesulfovibrio sp. zrk46]QJB55226.1 phospholipid carrier-dependent glycosyltransferase [Pseudodesulfovibrio sp. zrk46]